MRIKAAASLVLLVLVGACGTGPAGKRVPGPAASEASAAATPTPSAALPDLCPQAHSPAVKAGSDALPDLTLDCLGSHDRRNLRQLGGRPLLLNFWASWCGPCKIELPLLARAQREHGGSVSFVGVDVQDASADAAKILAVSGVRYPQLEDPRGITRGPFGWNGGLPMTVFVDAQGRMVATERTSFRTYAEVTDAMNRHLGPSRKDVER